MFKLQLARHNDIETLVNSSLYDQNSFYPAFLKDLGQCQSEVIIECPFITLKRITALLPTFRELRRRGACIVVNTKDPIEHDEYFQAQAGIAIALLQSIGVRVLYTGNHHRKLAIIDRSILYEGSLNILSQNDSAEIMRRLVSKELVEETIRLIGLYRFLN
jgi:hypothetical protein